MTAPTPSQKSVKELAGTIPKPRKPVSLREMDTVIANAAAGKK